MLLFWALTVTFAAPTPGLTSCCAATGQGNCPDELVAVGPGTQHSVSGPLTTYSGLWKLSCAEGARFEANASQQTQRVMPQGSVLTPVMPAAAACFDVSCELPQGLCLFQDQQSTKIGLCADHSQPPDAAWRALPRPPGKAVVIGGRVLNGHPAAPTTRPPTMSPPTPPVVDVDPSVPAPPPDPCIPAAALRTPSNQQVDQGNEAIVQGNLPEAIQRYRAALTINQCNAFAWGSLGEALLQAGHPEPAREALLAATRLMPTNVHQWTTLGTACERSGDLGAAIAAWEQALRIQPGHPPAAQALQRVR